MIGNEYDATRALNMYSCGDSTYLLSREGCTRVVYLIDGVVYKVESDWTGVNADEYSNMRSLTLPDGFYFPEVSLFSLGGGDNIIAMEYIDGIAVAECYCLDEECDETCAPIDVSDVMNNLGLDSGGFNVIITEKGYCIIDAG